MRRHFLRSAGGLLLNGLAMTALPARAADTSKTFTFGVVPQQSSTELARIWIPMLSMAAERSKLTLRFATAPDIPAFEKRLAQGAYDFAYMNPYHYTVFSQKPGYRAFAREKGRRLKGLIVVHKDSPIKTLAELANRQVAFPAPASFAATVLPRIELDSKGIKVDPKFVGSHESVYLNVAKGLISAGGGVQGTFQNADPAVRDELRVLWSTKEYTPHAFAAHPRVPAEVTAGLLATMTQLDADQQGKMALQGLAFRGFEAAQDGDWADVRALGISTLAALLKE